MTLEDTGGPFTLSIVRGHMPFWRELWCCVAPVMRQGPPTEGFIFFFCKKKKKTESEGRQGAGSMKILQLSGHGQSDC